MSTNGPHGSPPPEQYTGDPQPKNQYRSQPYSGGYSQQGGPAQTGQRQPDPYIGQHGYGNPAGYGYPQHTGGYGQPGGVGTQPGVSVGPVAAVKRFYGKYAQFSGRASRSEYWWALLFLAVVHVGLATLYWTFGLSPSGLENTFGFAMLALFIIFLLGSIIPTVALTIRRLHDIDMSGFVYLVTFIPYIGWLLMLIFMMVPPKPQGARFDR